MGYAIGTDHIEQMVDKINSCDPDIVIFAGDIFDNSIDGLDDPERLAQLLCFDRLQIRSLGDLRKPRY